MKNYAIPKIQTSNHAKIVKIVSAFMICVTLIFLTTYCAKYLIYAT